MTLVIVYNNDNASGGIVNVKAISIGTQFVEFITFK